MRARASVCVQFCGTHWLKVIMTVIMTVMPVCVGSGGGAVCVSEIVSVCVCVCCGRDWWCVSREVEICTTSTQRTAERRAHAIKALVVDAANIICACMCVVARSQKPSELMCWCEESMSCGRGAVSAPVDGTRTMERRPPQSMAATGVASVDESMRQSHVASA